MDYNGIQGIAYSWALGFGIKDDVYCIIYIGCLVNISMANTYTTGNYRNGGILPYHVN